MTYNWKDKVILIAEDEEDNYELLAALLEETNVTILKAVTGKEAIECFINFQPIDLVLMDLKLPDINGLEATKKIREINKGIPIIAQTAYALSGDREMSLLAGCSSYISKPIDSNKLFSLIASYFEK